MNGGDTISFGYDNDSLLTSAGEETITRRTDNGLITGTTLGTVTDARSYSTFGELSSYTANVSGAPVFSSGNRGQSELPPIAWTPCEGDRVVVSRPRVRQG